MRRGEESATGVKLVKEMDFAKLNDATLLPHAGGAMVHSNDARGRQMRLGGRAEDEVKFAGNRISNLCYTSIEE